MIKRIYDKFNSHCYIKVKCDSCGFAVSTVDGYGLRSKEYFKGLQHIGWKQLENGEIMCAYCSEKVANK